MLMQLRKKQRGKGKLDEEMSLRRCKYLVLAYNRIMMKMSISPFFHVSSPLLSFLHKLIKMGAL